MWDLMHLFNGTSEPSSQQETPEFPVLWSLGIDFSAESIEHEDQDEADHEEEAEQWKT
jgi:hypothetical protein